MKNNDIFSPGAKEAQDLQDWLCCKGGSGLSQPGVLLLLLLSSLCYVVVINDLLLCCCAARKGLT